eukprot:CAMPEP_0194550640 /NCGR_PEP_ID=MMETSP0253-20130528/95815_1 /TAXON_ID=2966 /ORGANISM="Noctiluca scintillans" /LENGTH=91 /DNA_ID=CAMNT_0039398081 /DNA_START=341 /DNA_END=616 /DNA_ORIENTATION=-
MRKQQGAQKNKLGADIQQVCKWYSIGLPPDGAMRGHRNWKGGNHTLSSKPSKGDGSFNCQEASQNLNSGGPALTPRRTQNHELPKDRPVPN